MLCVVFDIIYLTYSIFLVSIIPQTPRYQWLLVAGIAGSNPTGNIDIFLL
jgi:hypothetical protein